MLKKLVIKFKVYKLIHINPIVFLLVIASIAGCGGGGGGGSDSNTNDTVDVNSPPIVEISLSVSVPGDFSINEGQSSDLRGTAALLNSDKPITYIWEEFGTSLLTFANADSPETSFTAAAVEQDTTVTVGFSAITDDFSQPVTDTVSITIHAVNAVPVVDAGENLTVNALDDVELTATASDADGVISQYQWRQTAGPSVLSAPVAFQTINFRAVNLNLGEGSKDLEFEVVVTDDNGATAKDTITVTVNEYIPIGLMSDTNKRMNKILETAAIGAPVGIIAVATDPSFADAVSYSLADNAQGLFAINDVSGVITLASELDYQNSALHQLTVLARSTDGSSSERTFNVSVVSDQSADVSIEFPLNNSTFTGATITVRGRVNDTDLSNTTVLVEVGGAAVEADLYANGEFVAEEVNVVSDSGYAAVDVSVQHSDSHSSSASATLLTNLSLESPINSHYDETNNRVIVIDRELNALVAIDVLTGLHSILMQSEQLNSTVRLSAYDRLNNRLYFITSSTVDVIDLANYEISAVASATVGSGIEPELYETFTFDSSHDRLLVAAHNGDVIISIDTVTKERVQVSGNGVGSGDNFVKLSSIVCENSGKICYVLDRGTDPIRIFEINVDPDDINFGD
jgi:K319L-like, PKD domain/Cadherin domain